MRIMEVIEPKKESFFLPTMDAQGSILAEDVFVKKDLPSFDNSAMDGFAYLEQDGGKKLKIVGKIFAGEKDGCAIKEGECCKIMTGAKVPPSVNTIAPIEQCEDVTETSVTVPKLVKGSNLRKKGEELRQGELLLARGEIIAPAHIALLAAQGITAIKVVAPLSIAVVSSGDEIKEPWEVADEDEIYNANAFGIVALLKQYGFAPKYAGAIPDDLTKSKEFISKLKSYDVIISTGGISMGDADFLYQAFSSNGLESVFHGVNLKPGRPTMMGIMDKTLVMAMPGNPLTTMLNVFSLAIPPLYKKQGASKCFAQPLYVKTAKALKIRPGRDNIILGYLQDGLFYPTRDNKIGSGMLSPLVQSSVVAYFGQDHCGFEQGEWIKVVSLFDAARELHYTIINE